MRDNERYAEARRRAQALWEDNKKQAEKVLDEREKERLALQAKVERLRELRLTKEAADRKAATQALIRRGKPGG